MSTEKPTKQKVTPDMLRYHDVISYIENKYDIDTRDVYRNKKEPGVRLYVDFWHWFVDLTCNQGSLQPNGSTGFLPLTIEAAKNYCKWDEMNEVKQEGIKKVMDLIKKEFSEQAEEDDILQVWVTY